jgi:hypothetical protein
VQGILGGIEQYPTGSSYDEAAHEKRGQSNLLTRPLPLG